MDDITDSMDMSFSQLREIVKDREARRAAVHGVSKSQTRVIEQTRTKGISPSQGSSRELTVPLGPPMPFPEGQAKQSWLGTQQQAADKTQLHIQFSSITQSCPTL